jgi:guanylate kinase
MDPSGDTGSLLHSAMKTPKGKIVIISGPSGVGKSTICRAVLDRVHNLVLSTSATTREQAPTETHGKEYYFFSREDFQRGIDQGEFLEHAEVFGNFYGTPKAKVDDILAQGQNVLLEIDVQGARQIKALYSDALLIFILPPDDQALKKRLDGRGRDSHENVENRLKKAHTEIAAARQFYDDMVTNDALEQAIQDVIRIIQTNSKSKQMN